MSFFELESIDTVARITLKTIKFKIPVICTENHLTLATIHMHKIEYISPLKIICAFLRRLQFIQPVRSVKRTEAKMSDVPRKRKVLKPI